MKLDIVDAIVMHSPDIGLHTALRADSFRKEVRINNQILESALTIGIEYPRTADIYS